MGAVLFSRWKPTHSPHGSPGLKATSPGPTWATAIAESKAGRKRPTKAISNPGTRIPSVSQARGGHSHTLAGAERRRAINRISPDPARTHKTQRRRKKPSGMTPSSLQASPRHSIQLTAEPSLAGAEQVRPFPLIAQPQEPSEPCSRESAREVEGPQGTVSAIVGFTRAING